MREFKLRFDKETLGILSSIFLLTLLIAYSYVTSNTRAFLAVMSIIMIVIANIWKR